MLHKVETRFPKAVDLVERTDEKFNSPERRKIIQSCLGF